MSYEPKRTLLKKVQFPHELDHYLYLTLCKFDDEYVTWEYNEETGSYFYGHYFKTLPQAEVDFDKRWSELAR